MSYSQFYFKNQTKVPTVIAVFIVCFIGLFFIRLFSKTAIPSKADKKNLKRIEITNITPKQVVLYWQTDEKVTGWVIYGNKANQLNKIAYDERDLATSKNAFIHHYVVLKNLDENQQYFFKLVTNEKLLSNNAQDSFTFKTPKNITDFKGKNPAYGKVISGNGAPLENAIVFMTIGNTFSLSALTKLSGEWLIPINTLFEKETYAARTPGDKEKIRIEIISEENQTSVVNTDLSIVSPLPQSIVIGNDFDFSDAEEVLSSMTSREPEVSTKTVDIIYPKENALIPGYSPLIKGVSLPNEEVMIEVHSETSFSSKVRADEKGVWKLNLPSNLAPGEHTIIIRAKDNTGNFVMVERKFTIAKGGEQVLGNATPAGTITPTKSVLTPTPTTIITSTPPVSGGNITSSLISGASLIIMGIGLLLVF